MKIRVKNIISSIHEAARQLDEVWIESKALHATGTVGNIVGGLLTVAGGIATAMTAGVATPLLVAGMGIGVAGAGTSLLTSYRETAINCSEIKKAERKLQDVRESIADMNNTIQMWLETKEDARLLYICCLAELKPDKNYLVTKLLQKVVLQTIMLSAVNVLQATGRTATRPGVFVADLVVYRTVNAATKGLGGGRAKAASQVASKVTIGVSAALVLWDVIDLYYTIKDS